MEDIVPPTRKRNRSAEEEDFLPLSKKINNLHINKWGGDETASSTPTNHTWSSQSSEWPPPQPSFNEFNFPSTSQFGSQKNFNPTDNECHVSEQFQGMNFLNATYPNPPADVETQDANGWPTSYSPDLSLEENPFYYENNKLLFELYLERLHRGVY